MAAAGELVRIAGTGAGGWKLAQNAGQTINGRNLGVEDGATWTAREADRSGIFVAASAAGDSFAAVGYGVQIHTSTTWTTVGTAGSISGAACDSIELQSLGEGRFNVIGHEGSLTVE